MKKATPTSLIALLRCPYALFCLHTTICHHSKAKKNLKIKHALTLRGLSLFFKTLPISNPGDSIAYTVHFLYPKLGSFPDMDYYFHQLAYRDSNVPKRFIGSNQMQYSPSFDWNWGKQNDPTACWHQLHPQFQVSQQGKCLRYPPECVGGVKKCKIRWQQGGCAPF